MNDEEHVEKEPRRHGPPGMHGGIEKPKNLRKAIRAKIQFVTNIIRIVPIKRVVALTKVESDWFIAWAIVSMSFVTLDKISPVACWSKYFNGNLFILVEILLRSFLANLLAAWVIVIDSK